MYSYSSTMLRNRGVKMCCRSQCYIIQLSHDTDPATSPQNHGWSTSSIDRPLSEELHKWVLFVFQGTHGQRPWLTWCSGGLLVQLQPLSSCSMAKTLWMPPNWFTRRRWTECVCVRVRSSWASRLVPRHLHWLPPQVWTLDWSVASVLPCQTQFICLFFFCCTAHTPSHGLHFISYNTLYLGCFAGLLVLLVLCLIS